MIIRKKPAPPRALHEPFRLNGALLAESARTGCARDVPAARNSIPTRNHRVPTTGNLPSTSGSV